MGELFNFSVQIVGSVVAFLYVKSVSTISCRCSCEVELLQADGSTTMQELLVSICSMTNAGLKMCMVPSQLVCTHVSRDRHGHEDPGQAVHGSASPGCDC